MNETTATLIITVLLIVFTVLPYVRRMKQKEAKARKKFHDLKITGLDEATMMHPQIDPLKCIGCGSCVRACHEGDVLGIIEGKAQLIHGAKCVGHAMCEEACPVGAIQMLMAKPGRSADLPVINEHFETNVKGVYIVGELGGLALIKNAIVQGKKVIENIMKQRSSHSAEYDVAIIGAGPAGLASGLSALEKKLKYVVIEQSDIGGTVLQYPRNKVVMTSPVDLPLWGRIKFTKVSKETLLMLWQKVLAKTSLKINTDEKVTEIKKEEKGFDITTSKRHYTARYVVLALGRRGTPRKLGVPGEQQPKVAYRLIDAAQYQNEHILVVGGGDSAIEAAVGLATQHKNVVTLSYRKGEFTRIKERNMLHLKDYCAKKKIIVRFNSDVKEILKNNVLLQTEEGILELKNDRVFIFAGGEVPNEFLKKIGVEMQVKVTE
jgi:thioredoxin reductase (NADPH)